MEPCVSRPLYGGALLAEIPARFVDVSTFRQLPDNQEVGRRCVWALLRTQPLSNNAVPVQVFADDTRDQSLIVEVLEYTASADDGAVGPYHFELLARDNGASSASVAQVAQLTDADVPHFAPENVPGGARC